MGGHSVILLLSRDRIMVLKLYSHPFSPYGRMAQSVLELSNTPYEMQCVDLFAHENDEEWYQKINKKKQVPVLVDGDFTITESSVIMKYICNKIGDTSLYPTDPKLRAQIDEAIQRTSLIKFSLFLPILFGKVEDIDYEKKAEFEESLNKFLAPYKKNAEKTGYLFGNSITIADIAMIMKCTMARIAGYHWTKFPSIGKLAKNNYNEKWMQVVNREVFKIVEKDIHVIPPKLGFNNYRSYGDGKAGVWE